MRIITGSLALLLSGSMLMSGAHAAETGDLAQLNLDKRCGQCHDVSDPGALSRDDWLTRLRDLGPIESLTAKEQAEVIGFLRYHGWEVAEIVQMADERHLFEDKCSLCHSADRAFVREMTPELRRATVMRMRERAPQWLSQQDAERILHFLESGARGVRKPEHLNVSGGGDDAFRVRCSVCHPLERSYLYIEDHGADVAWAPLVKRMQLKAPEWISDEEAAAITAYLQAQRPLLTSR